MRTLSPNQIEEAVELLLAEELVVYPTDTLYGLGAILTKHALGKLFEAKRRDNKPVSITVASTEEIEKYAVVDATLLKKFLPGPLTVLLRKKQTVPNSLTLGSELVGIRVPDNPIALELASRCGALTATSANVSGERPAVEPNEVNVSASAVIDGGKLSGEPSTIVDLVNLKILRCGAGADAAKALLNSFKAANCP